MDIEPVYRAGNDFDLLSTFQVRFVSLYAYCVSWMYVSSHGLVSLFFSALAVVSARSKVYLTSFEFIMSKN